MEYCTYLDESPLDATRTWSSNSSFFFPFFLLSVCLTYLTALNTLGRGSRAKPRLGHIIPAARPCRCHALVLAFALLWYQ